MDALRMVTFLLVTKSVHLEWLQIFSTPLQKVRGNSTLGVFPVPWIKHAKPDQDPFACPEIHNLTMAGYARAEKVPPVDNTIDELFGEGGASRREQEYFLNKLKRKIEFQIEDQIRDLSSERRARGHHIAFPSMESALVSMSFLLIAVYLIKLIMKLMYQIQFKRGKTDALSFLGDLRQPIMIEQNRQIRSIAMENLRLKKVFNRNYAAFH